MPADMISAALGVVFGLVLGLGFGIALWRRPYASIKAEAEKHKQRFEEAFKNHIQAEHRAERADKLEADLTAAREEISHLRSDMAARDARMSEREQAVLKEREALTALRGELEEKFKSLAHDTFKASQKSFLELAEENFKHHKSTASADMEKRQEAIANLLKPMQESLKRYEENLSAIEKSRHEAYGNLSSELKNVIEAQQGVRTETAKLVTALRAQPKTRGRWGEQQLQNVMELAGMSEHVDFSTQSSFTDTDENRLIPDAIIRLPGGRTIVVDAKTSLSAYFDAIDAVDETEREAYLVKHGREIRTHMKQLASKTYWRDLHETPDFVAMFIPGENFYAAAIERDPELFEDAISNRVLIVTPTTLIALAKAVAYGWRQEAMAENARHVADLGKDLYGRLSTFGGHVAKAGRGLETAVRSYNDMIGSLERKVMPQARKFQDLKVEGTGKELDALNPVETDVRPLTSKELLLEGEGDD